MTEDIETLTEAELERSYEEVTDIQIHLTSKTVYYETNKTDLEEKLCTFKELLRSGIPDLDDIVFPDSIRKEVEKLQDDLENYWNNTGRELYELEYDYKEGKPPYRIYLPFTTDLVDNKTILETHDKDGNFIAGDALSDMDEALFKLESYNIYGHNKSSDNWGLYDVQILDGYYERYRKSLGNFNYRKEDMRESIEGIILALIFFIPSTIVPALTGISLLSWFIIWMLIGPPWTQHLLTIDLIVRLKYRILSIYKVITEKQYEDKKFLEVDSK